MPPIQPRLGTTVRRVLPLSLLVAAVASTTALQSQQVVGPLQVTMVGDTSADEGQRVSYSLFPWPGRQIEGGAVYEWDFGDGSPTISRAEKTAVGHRFMTPGTYTVKATDGAGVTFLTVDVRPVPPTIDVMSYDWPRKPGEPSRFQALARDPGHGPLTYTWDFGDGSPPRSGVDLTDVAHVYRAHGIYKVTLLVTDEHGQEARRVIQAQANPGFFGQLSGDAQRPVVAVSGKATLANPLPGSRAMPTGLLTLFTGATPLGGGAADLSEAFGVCLVTAGFWDDTNKLHVNFMWTADSTTLLDLPQSFPATWHRPAGEGEMPKGQMMVNMLVLDIDPSYEDTKRGAETHQVFDPGAAGLLDNLQGLLSAMMGGGGGGGARPQGNPGRNWQLTSLQQAGQVTISSITPERITGWMNVQLAGGWLSMAPEGVGAARGVNLQGAFRWELDDTARANLLRCGERPFEIVAHTPDVEARGVDYETPSVSVTFSLPAERASMTADTLELGYPDSSGTFTRIDSRIIHTADPKVVRIEPRELLNDGVYYVVRVRGGEGGVRSELRDALVGDYQWRFLTMPELVARPRVRR